MLSVPLWKLLTKCAPGTVCLFACLSVCLFVCLSRLAMCLLWVSLLMHWVAIIIIIDIIITAITRCWLWVALWGFLTLRSSGHCLLFVCLSACLLVFLSVCLGLLGAGSGFLSGGYIWVLSLGSSLGCSLGVVNLTCSRSRPTGAPWGSNHSCDAHSLFGSPPSPSLALGQGVRQNLRPEVTHFVLRGHL